MIQLGDFNYSQPTSKECVDLFNQLRHPKLHVLGNHDMDKCDKAAAMRFWGMKARYGALSMRGYRASIQPRAIRMRTSISGVG